MFFTPEPSTSTGYGPWFFMRHEDGSYSVHAQSPMSSDASLRFTDEGAVLHADMDGGFNEVDVLVPWGVIDWLREHGGQAPDGLPVVTVPTSR